MRLSLGGLTTGLAFWHCAHSMWSRVYKTVRCPSVRLSVSQSVPSVERSSGVRRVCCWAPYAQKISIDSAGRQRRAPGSSSAAARDRSTALSSKCGQYQLTRLNTDGLVSILGLLKFYQCSLLMWSLCPDGNMHGIIISTHWADWTWMDRRTKISSISSWKSGNPMYTV